MEGVEWALKSSLRLETAAKRTQEYPLSMTCGRLTVKTAVSGDDFLVDNLLDFSNGDIEDGILEAEGKGEYVEYTNPCSPSLSLQKLEKNQEIDCPGTNFYVVDDFVSVPRSKLSVPVLEEIRPYLVGAAGGSLEFVAIEEPIVKVRITGPAAGVTTVRVAVTQKLREKIPSIAAVQLL